MADVSTLTPGTWNIDPSHTIVGFTARHLMITKVRGRFTGVTGVLDIAEDRARSTVQASVDLASVSTGDETRDDHLRSADFFDVENHPTMTFRSTGIKFDGDDLVLLGDLTIRGVTCPVELECEFEGVAQDPWGNTKASFSAEAEVNRRDWGLEWNVALDSGGVLVSEKVKIEIEAQAVKA